MIFEIKGILKEVSDIKKVSDKFQTREFILLIEDDCNEKFDNYIKFQLINKDCEQLDRLNKKCLIVVKFKLQGRNYKGKYYTNLIASKVAQITGVDEFESESKTF